MEPVGQCRRGPHAQAIAVMQAEVSCAAMRHRYAEHIWQAAAHNCNDGLHVAGAGQGRHLCSACSSIRF